MNRVMKKAVSAVLSLAMLASSTAALNAGVLKDTFTLTASAASETTHTRTINNVIYRIYDNKDKAVVIGSNRNAYSFTIPRQVLDPDTNTYKTVTDIEPLVFMNRSNVWSVRINAHITTLPAYTFRGCVNLHEVALPPTLREIPQLAFFGTAISKINIPYACRTVASQAFLACDDLNTVIVHNPSTQFASDAFGYMTGNSKTAYTYPGSARAFLSNLGFTNYQLKSGDIDGDGFVTTTDARLILIDCTRRTAGLPSSLTSEQRRWADVDGNGLVEYEDAQAIDYVAGNIGSDCPQNFEYLLLHFFFNKR